MKSSHIGKNHERRKRVIAKLLPLKFNVFSIVFDKSKMLGYPGLRFKKSFYKFINNIVHKELRRAFSKITIVSDEIGGSDYMKSFSNYVESKMDIPNLFGEADFLFESSQNDVIIQLADLVCGTIAFVFDRHRKTKDTPNYVRMLNSKIIRIQEYPHTIDNYVVDNSAIAEEYDKTIANLCLKQAVEYIQRNENSEEEEIQERIIVLQYLLFRFMNNDLRAYISTKELKNQLRYAGYGDISTQTFRTRIIGKLRDNGVIISGSSAKKAIKSHQKKKNCLTSLIMEQLLFYLC